MKVTIVNNNKGEGDWKGIYIDGKLYIEGHRFLDHDLAFIFGELGHDTRVISLTDDQMEKFSKLPKDLDKIKDEKEERL